MSKYSLISRITMWLTLEHYRCELCRSTHSQIFFFFNQTVLHCCLNPQMWNRRYRGPTVGLKYPRILVSPAGTEGWPHCLGVFSTLKPCDIKQKHLMEPLFLCNLTSLFPFCSLLFSSQFHPLNFLFFIIITYPFFLKRESYLNLSESELVLQWLGFILCC